MAKREKIVVSAYTGVLMCDFGDLHKYIEDKLGCPVWTHELASTAVWKAIERAAKPEFMQIVTGKDITTKIASEIRTLRVDAKETWDAGEADRYEARADALEWVLGQLNGENTPCPWAHYETKEDKAHG